MQKTYKLKTTNRILRALIARLLCLVHIGLSIYVLYSVKKDFLYLIPIIGAILILAEMSVVLIVFKGKEPFLWFSPLFFVYVVTIVGCYWFLELENVNKVIKLGIKRIDRVYITPEDLVGDMVGVIKVIWSQLEIQIFFGLIIIIRWIIPKNTSLSPLTLSELLFKYFAIMCDMLDFLSILQDDKLINNRVLIYFTLSAWSWSSCQFFIFTPKLDDEEFTEFTRYITNSLLAVLFLDLPYFGVRIAAIFAFGSHNYNSYFFVTKNLIMILLQLFAIKATFSERVIRTNKAAKQLKNLPGFDREGRKLFDPNEIAKQNFIAQRLRAKENATPDSMYREITEVSIAGLGEKNNSSNSLDEIGEQQINNIKKMPRTIETVVYNKRALYADKSGRNNNSNDELNSNIQIRNENDTYIDDYNHNNERNMNFPQNFEENDEKNGKFTTQIRRPEPRTNYKQNIHQYGLKLENTNDNVSVDLNRKNQFKANPSKNTDV